VDSNADWAHCLVCCEVGSEVATGVITDDSETFRLYNLEAEVVGGACGAPDRDGVI